MASTGDDRPVAPTITMLRKAFHETGNYQEALVNFNVALESANHISQLPTDVFGDIARIVVEDDHTTLISLLHVCKRWRTVIWNTPSLWAKLVLTSRRPKPKAKLWIERSNGEVKALVVRNGASGSYNWPESSLDGLQWDGLLVFQGEGWAFFPHFQATGQESAIAKWIRMTMEGHDTLPLDSHPAPFSLHSLSLNKTQVDINGAKLCERLTALRSFTIRSCFATTGSWANVLKVNPLLERLELHTTNPVNNTPLSGVLKLEHLTTLEADFSAPIDIFTAMMPHLRNLRLISPCYDTDAFLRHLTGMLVGGLTKLGLHGCRLNDRTSILFLLRISPNLQVLEVTSVASQVASLLQALTAHYTLPPSLIIHDGPTVDPSPVLCPKLTHVNFSGCPEVQAGLLMRFIESRLIGQQQTAMTNVLKIESLTIDFCRNVERECVRWLEEFVPHVSSRCARTIE